MLQQSELAVGRWVYYKPTYGRREKGIIKSWSDFWVFVVFNCGGDWNNFRKCRADEVHRKYLIFTEEPDQ